jgi:hypothetical protein
LGTTSVGAPKAASSSTAIFFDRPAGRFWWQPLLALDPILPIGIRLDQTGIACRRRLFSPRLSVAPELMIRMLITANTPGEAKE